MSHHPVTNRSGRTRRAGWIAAATVLALLGAGCGDDSGTGGTAEATGDTAAPTTTAPEAAPVTVDVPDGATDAALAHAALLADGDLEGWAVGPPEYAFPNSVELARQVPACADQAELVFTGGDEHGQGESEMLTRDADLLFTYVVVFPTEEQAAAMVEAISDPAFDDCWADFNAIAVPTLPIQVNSAEYEAQEPPELSIDADAYDVEYLTGSVDADGVTLDDSCVCVFAQSGRGVVEVHSIDQAFDLEERAAAVQVAVDKLATTLGSA